MSQLENPLEVYKLLPKSNCRKCDMPTCLAFAAAVVKGQKHIKDCPHLENNIIERFDIKIDKRVSPEEQQQIQLLEQLKSKIAKIDFSSSAQRLGASLAGGKLKIKCLGRDFIVDPQGNITSECHVIPLIALPILDYVISCSEKNVAGEWVPFRELKKVGMWNALYEQTSGKPFKQIADNHLDLLLDLLVIFGGRTTDNRFSADIAFVIYPLPKVPMLINYFKPEDDLESKLNVFYDVTVEDNLSIEAIYGLSAGIVRMFQKIILRHGRQSAINLK